jgi:hypothetical protein
VTTRAYFLAIAELVAVVMGRVPERDVAMRCPGVSPHVLPASKGYVDLEWVEGRIDGRTLYHTCTCGLTQYELIACGGVYRIRRTSIDRYLPEYSYTHTWRRLEAEEWWQRLINGRAA